MEKISPGAGAPLNAKPAFLANPDLEDASLKKACEEFEAMMLTQLISAMRTTTFKSDLVGNSQEDEMYNSMFNDALAKTMAQQDGIGLANLLYQQFKGEPNK